VCLCMYVDTHLCGKWPASVCHALHPMNAFPPSRSFFPFPPFPSPLPSSQDLPLRGRWQRMLMEGRKEGTASLAWRPRTRRQGGAGALALLRRFSSAPVVVLCGGGGGGYGLVKRGSGVGALMLPVRMNIDRGCLLLACLPGRRNYKGKSKGKPPSGEPMRGEQRNKQGHLRPPPRTPCLDARPANHSPMCITCQFASSRQSQGLPGRCDYATTKARARGALLPLPAPYVPTRQPHAPAITANPPTTAIR
jgi:hypothetical protein